MGLRVISKFTIFAFLSLVVILILREPGLIRSTRCKICFVRPPAQQQYKRFIYLIQTEECIPKRLLENKYMGSSSGCDIIVFSFKKKCTVNHQNIQYIYAGSYTTWSVGRNLLYDAAKANKIPYLYYIFLDDDIVIDFNPKFASKSFISSAVSPIRAFEEFLLSYEPAIGLTNARLGHHDADFYIEIINEICPGPNLTTPLQIPVVHFDAIFNAFHRNSVNHLLPYSSKNDQVNWWDSQRLVITLAEMIFRGHTIMYTPVDCWNSAHRPYPKKHRYNTNYTRKVWSQLANESKKLIPHEYQNEEWIQEFIDHPIRYTDYAPSLCMELPVHHPIKPFSHFMLKNKTDSA